MSSDKFKKERRVQERETHAAIQALTRSLLSVDDLPNEIKLVCRLMRTDVVRRFDVFVSSVMDIAAPENKVPSEQDIETVEEAIAYLELVAAGLDSFIESHPGILNAVSNYYSTEK